MTSFTAREQSIIDEINKTIKASKVPDNDPRNIYCGDEDRFGNKIYTVANYFFNGGSVKKFQQHAKDIAAIIEEQGIQKTSPAFLSLAKRLKGIPEIIWNHHSLGFAFEKAIKEVGARNSLNPLKKLNL